MDRPKETKRKNKLKSRQDAKREQAEKSKASTINKPKFVVGTGARIDNKEADCPGLAAPKHVFVARTAMSTTKETVQGCLEYLAGIKSIAVCCTPQERIDSGEAFSLSWRVQVENDDYEKALLPTSWKSGWAVKPYFFRRKKPERPNITSEALAQLLVQAGNTPLALNGHP